MRNQARGEYAIARPRDIFFRSTSDDAPSPIFLFISASCGVDRLWPRLLVTFHLCRERHGCCCCQGDYRPSEGLHGPEGTVGKLPGRGGQVGLSKEES